MWRTLTYILQPNQKMSWINGKLNGISLLIAKGTILKNSSHGCLD